MESISVVLCTHNRCATLAVALSSVAAQVLPESVSWEVLVVDNDSSDHTREVVTDAINQHPNRFRYVFEKHPGLSHARNTGIRETSGGVIAFMDDDTTVPSTWLNRLTAGLHNGEWAGAGGRILPQVDLASCPSWLRDELLWNRYGYYSGPLALFDLGSDAGELNSPPFGANMAYRREMFGRDGCFRTDLGRRPGSLMSSEESEFGKRLLAAGERIRYEPAAVVYHPVPESRMQKEYFLKWSFDKARSDVRAFGPVHDTRRSFRGIPLGSFCRVARWTVSWLLAKEESRRFFYKLNVWANLGEISEYYHLNLSQTQHLVDCGPDLPPTHRRPRTG